MRTIKCRVWDLDNKCMDDHFYIHAGGIVYDNPSRTFDTPNIEIEENPNLIVMQFTGMKDENGVEICEGDKVVDDYDVEGIVEYDDEYAMFVFKDSERFNVALCSAGPLTITGHIYSEVV